MNQKTTIFQLTKTISDLSISRFDDAGVREYLGTLLGDGLGVASLAVERFLVDQNSCWFQLLIARGTFETSLVKAFAS